LDRPPVQQRVGWVDERNPAFTVIAIFTTNSARYDFPLSLWPIQHRFGSTVLLTYRDFQRFDPIDRPLDKLLNKLKRDGHDITDASAQYDLMLSVMQTMDWQFDALRMLFVKQEKMGINVRPA